MSTTAPREIQPRRPLIVLVDADAHSADAHIAPWAAAAERLGRLARSRPDAAACADALHGRDPGEPALVVFGPDVEAPQRIARALAQRRVADHLVFVVQPDQEQALRRSLSYSGITVPWTLVTQDNARPETVLGGAIDSVRQRNRFRSTLDRMNLQLRQPVDPTAYRHLVVSNRYLDSILRHASDAIFSLDSKGVVRTWNRGSEQLFGVSEVGALGHRIQTLAGWPERQLQAAFDQALSGAAPRFEMELTRGQQALTVDMTLTPVEDEDGSVIGIAAIARDISHRKQAERERERVLEAERAARAELEQLGRMKDEFLAVLSHELKTPLSAVLGYAAVLQRLAGTNQAQSNAADGIARNARAQARLIDELLDMSAINAGKLRLDLQPVSAAALVRGAVESIRPSAASRGIALDVDVDEGAQLQADPDRVVQILSNLLINAVKFSREGGRVQVSVRRRDHVVELVVADQGEGIAAEFLPHVFDRFAQADSSTRRRHGGLGLGLSIVRQLTELHGGSVTAESAGRGRGAAFTVSLPAAEAGAEARADGHGVADQAELDGLNVLIVDDEPDAREVLRLLMSTLGASSQVAAGADEGLELLDHESFDLLLSDISMPGRNGYEFVRMLRNSPKQRLQQLPAIAVTAFGRAEDRREALQAGYDAHVPKPVELPALLNAIGQVVRREA